MSVKADILSLWTYDGCEQKSLLPPILLFVSSRQLIKRPEQDGYGLFYNYESCKDTPEESKNKNMEVKMSIMGPFRGARTSESCRVEICNSIKMSSESSM